MTFDINQGGTGDDEMYGQLGDDFVAFHRVVPRPLEDGPGGSYLHVGVIDGRESVTFLKRIKECLEDPERLLLEV